MVNLWVAVYFFGGIIIGSFLNVVIFRLPQGYSVIFPSSHCTHCGTRLRVVDLLPILSFLWLKGRCRYCNAKISFCYPLVELLTGMFFILCFFVFGNSVKLIISLILGCILIVIVAIDVSCHLIPDKIVAFGLIIALVINFFDPELSFASSVLGMLSGGSLLYVIALASRGGMGGGDIKLSAMLGAFLGWDKLLAALALAFLSGGIIGLILIAWKIKKKKDIIPFAPFLALGALVSLLWGSEIINWYLSAFLY